MTDHSPHQTEQGVVTTIAKATCTELGSIRLDMRVAFDGCVQEYRTLLEVGKDMRASAQAVGFVDDMYSSPVSRGRQQNHGLHQALHRTM